MFGGSVGKEQIFLYLFAYLLIFSSICAYMISNTVTPITVNALPIDINNVNPTTNPASAADFIGTFLLLLSWVLPPQLMDYTLQAIFIKLPEIAMAVIIVIWAKEMV